MRRFLTAGALVLALAAVAGCSGKAEEGKDLSGRAPDFTLWSVSGSQVKLSDYAGDVVVLDFWATWCPPCKEMIPVLSRLHRKLADRGVTVLGVSLDREGAAVLEPFIMEMKIPYPVLMGDDKVKRAFGGIATIPTLFIVDREGRLVRKLVGYHSYGQIRDEVERYL